MLIFIDDSGDPSFKVGKGSSKVFVITLVIFDDELEAEEAALKIKKLRRQLGLHDKFEFKFNKCSKEFRCKLLSTVADSRFRVRAIVLKKSKIYGQMLRNKKEYFYNYAIKTVLKNHAGTIKNAKIRLDGHGNRNMRRAFSSYLRRELNPLSHGSNRIFTNLRFRDSKRDVLIQLADMIAGAIRRSYYRDKDDAGLYVGIIKKRLEDIWNFGRP